MMNHYTLRDIRASLPPEKNRADSYWTRWVLRPLSIPAAWLFLRLGISANSVSYASGLIAILGGILMASDDFGWIAAGAAVLNLFAILDCADGNVARVTKTTGPWGAWADALGGYAASASVLLGSGIAAQYLAPAELPGLEMLAIPLPEGGWAAVGGLAAVANLFMRLAYQGYKNVAGGGAASEIAGEKRLSENLGVTGLLIPAVFVGTLTGTLPWVVLFYTAFYCAGCAYSVAKLVRKVERLAKAGRNPEGCAEEPVFKRLPRRGSRGTPRGSSGTCSRR